VWWVKEELDLTRMQTAAARFVGFHDFKSFSDADPREGSTEVMLEALDIREDGDVIVFRVDGSHFIWKLVRRLVGVIVEVGRGGLTPDEGRWSAVIGLRSAGAIDRAGLWDSFSRRFATKATGLIRDDCFAAASHPSTEDKRRAGRKCPGHGRWRNRPRVYGWPSAHERHRGDSLSELLIVEFLQHRGAVRVPLFHGRHHIRLRRRLGIDHWDRRLATECAQQLQVDIDDVHQTLGEAFLRRSRLETVFAFRHRIRDPDQAIGVSCPVSLQIAGNRHARRTSLRHRAARCQQHAKYSETHHETVS
jgi:hypothetical protein